jgi:hypothetical protein
VSLSLIELLLTCGGLLRNNLESGIDRSMREDHFIFVVYGAFVYFCSHFSRMTLDMPSFIVRKSYTSLLPWFKSLSLPLIDRSLREEVKLSLIDDTKVKVYVAFEPPMQK